LLTATQRTLRARAAAYALHAQGGTSTKAGTAAFLERFEREVDPVGVLTPEERGRRAGFARKSYFAKLNPTGCEIRYHRIGRHRDGQVARDPAQPP
jgi:hypothetical protein